MRRGLAQNGGRRRLKVPRQRPPRRLAAGRRMGPASRTCPVHSARRRKTAPARDWAPCRGRARGSDSRRRTDEVDAAPGGGMKIVDHILGTARRAFDDKIGALQQARKHLPERPRKSPRDRVAEIRRIAVLQIMLLHSKFWTIPEVLHREMPCHHLSYRHLSYIV
jgi:hypothetical protein